MALKHLQSSVKEVAIPDIYKDYVVTQTERQTQIDYYNPSPMHSG